MPFDFTQHSPEVTIKDRHCGYGKSTDLIASLSSERSYLIVLPLNSEVQRFINDAPVALVEPITVESGGIHRRKRDHLRELLNGGHSIVTTHALFTDVAFLAMEGLLLGYDVVVDEVLSVVRCVTQELLTDGAKANGVAIKSWKGLYLDHGFATVDQETGMVRATEEWDRKQDLPELSKALFNMAKADCLFSVGDNVLLWELPPVLLMAVGSLTVYTFLAEGSLMASFMRRNGIVFDLDRDPASERRFRDQARSLIDVRGMPSINKLRFSYSAQNAMTKADHSRVSAALKRLRERDLKGTDRNNVMITSAKSMWFGRNGKPGPFSSQSRLFQDTNWLPNTTRGTNDYRHCSHLIYLYDQNINPSIAQFLGGSCREVGGNLKVA